MFRRASIHYGRTPDPETPYQKAAQVWDERIGSARVQARNWRLIAFIRCANFRIGRRSRAKIPTAVRIRYAPVTGFELRCAEAARSKSWASSGAVG